MTDTPWTPELVEVLRKLVDCMDARAHVVIYVGLDPFCALADDPARAWLLAILKAKIAEEDG